MLWPSDQDLASRDAEVPGIGTVLDPDALAAALRAGGLAGLESVTPTYVRYKPRTSCLVAFDARFAGRDAPRRGYVTAYAAAAAAKARKAAAEGEALVLGGIHAAARLFPADRALTTLAALADEDATRSLLSRLEAGPARGGALEVLPLAYKPERRCVALLRDDGVARAVLRFHSPRAFARASRNVKVLSPGRVLRLPARLGRSERDGVIAVGWVPGVGLDVLLRDHPVEADRALVPVGHALAELHLAPVRKLHHASREDEAAAVEAAADALARLCPALAGRAAALAGTLAGRLLDRPPAAAAIHGDLHARQVLIDGDGGAGVTLIDLDEARAGDPAWDIGSFLAHELVGAGAARAGDRLGPLLEGYARLAAPPSAEDIACQTAAGLLRLATRPFRDRLPDWPERAARTLDLAEEVAGRPAPRPPAPPHAAVPVTDPFSAGLDPEMPFLAGALDPRRAARDVVPRGVRLCAIRVTRHKPGRRCIVEYDVEPGTLAAGTRAAVGGGETRSTLVAKVRAKGADARCFRLCVRLRASGFDDGAADGIRVPEPLAIVPALRLWVQRKVPGVTATTLLAGPRGPEVARRLADAAVKLHRLAQPTGRVHGPEEEMTILRERLGELARQRPEWSGRLAVLADACGRLAAALPRAPLRTIHRDFYPDQVLVGDDGGTYILDLDLAADGDPALDVGNCLAHMTELALRTLGGPEALAACESVLEDRFIATCGEADPAAARARVRAYALLSLARHVQISTRFADRWPWSEAILRRCERELGLG